MALEDLKLMTHLYRMRHGVVIQKVWETINAAIIYIIIICLKMSFHDCNRL